MRKNNERCLNMRRPAISEIIKNSSSQTGEKDKVRVLVENDSFALRTILKYALDSKIKWLLPPGDPPSPPFKPKALAANIDAEGMLYSRARTLYCYVNNDGYQVDMTPAKREIHYICFLESLHPDDARLMIDIKEKKIPGLNKKVVNKAFPGLIA